MKISGTGEFGLIAEIKKMFKTPAGVVKGIGDDCAIVRSGRAYLLYTIDSVVEGVHFDLRLGGTWRDAGYKALVRSVSDIAAMGGVPRWFLFSVMMPPSFLHDDFIELNKGVHEAAKEYGVHLLGGDITTSRNTAITISSIGESDGFPVLRSGAVPGDAVFVSGFPGSARAGLDLLRKRQKNPKKSFVCRPSAKFIASYLRPAAQLKLGYILRKQKIASAMIDISDGLAGDLGHILRQSKAGAKIYRDMLPVATDMRKIFSGNEILGFILNGGDDYDLLFTAKTAKTGMIMELSYNLNIPITKIGIVTKQKDLLLIDGTKETKLAARSYEHFTA